jgi:hypothetical protein
MAQRLAGVARARVGAVHGLAGSAAVSLLVLATLRSTAGAFMYLLIFGLRHDHRHDRWTAIMAYPVSLALRYRRARQALAVWPSASARSCSASSTGSG